MPRPFKLQSDGTFKVSLGDHERQLLANLAPQLVALLSDGPTDPVRRLFPTAYPSDEQLEADYQSLVADDLLRTRLADLEAVETTAMNATLTESDLTKWMKAINGIRLVLGTQLDVSEETIAPEDDDPSAPTFALYEYLGYLTENIVQVLTTH